MGERCRSNFINEELYRDGEGLFPVPVTGPTELLVDRLEKSPDLEVTDHPIFQIFAGERNSFVSTVLIDTYFGVPKDWKPAPSSTPRVIAASTASRQVLKIKLLLFEHVFVTLSCF